MIAERFARGIGADTFEGTGAPPGPGVSSWLSGEIGAGPDGFEMVASRGQRSWATFRLVYLTNPWVYAAVNMIAGTISRMPLNVTAIDPANGDSVVQRADWPITPGRPSRGQYLDQLFNQPLGRVSRQAMVKRTLIDRLVKGNALWEVVGGDGLPDGLRSIPWRAVRGIDEDEFGLPRSYQIAQDMRSSKISSAATRTLLAIDAIHFGRGSDPDLPVGVSPLAACRNTLKLHDAITRTLLAWFRNSMRPSGHLTVDKLTREKAREIREMIFDAYASPENAGQVLVTSGKFEAAQQPPSQSEVIELLHASREETAAAYHIPPPVLGILDKAIKANVVELRSQYIRDTVGEWTGDLEGDIDAQMLSAPVWRGLDADFDMSEQLRPDMEALAISLNEVNDTMSVDDRRLALGLKPFRKPWSIVPWSKPGSLPLDKAVSDAAAVPSQAAAALAAAYASAPNGNGRHNGHHTHEDDLDEEDPA